MFLHELTSPIGSRKRRKIVGRGKGSGHGKTSCKGQKGQNCRSGRATILGSEGGQMPLIRRLPKVGFRSKRPIIYQIVQLDSLKNFKEGTVVDVNFLKSKGLIKNIYKPFKVLGNGEISKSLTIKAFSISKSAQEKIAKAGGKFEIISGESLKKELEASDKKSS